MAKKITLDEKTIARLKDKLSGDIAYILFTSDAEQPLHDFLMEWKNGTQAGLPGFIIAVVNAYSGMVRRGGDGRYAGKIRFE